MPSQVEKVIQIKAALKLRFFPLIQKALNKPEWDENKHEKIGSREPWPHMRWWVSPTWMILLLHLQ